MRISDWSSDVCSSDLPHLQPDQAALQGEQSGHILMMPVVAAMVGNASQRFSHQSDPQRKKRRVIWGPRRRRIKRDVRKSGRASGRESVWQYVLISVVAGNLKKKNKTNNNDERR